MSTTILLPLTALRYYNGQNLPLEDQYYTDELVDYRTSTLQIRQLRVTEGKDFCTTVEPLWFLNVNRGY